jgi:hypothetical protein
MSVHQRYIKMKYGPALACPHCHTYSGWGYEWAIQQGERVGWWRCILCGERSQDHVPDPAPDNPMLRHRMPESNLVGG